MWLYQQSLIHHLHDLPDHQNLFGFCYKITNLQTGQIYIGKKQLYSIQKKRLPKKNQPTDKRKKNYQTVIKQSDWINYWGSNQQLKKDVQQFGATQFQREILALARSKKYLGYLEVKYQFIYDVLNCKTYNQNILGKYYPQDLEDHPNKKMLTGNNNR